MKKINTILIAFILLALSSLETKAQLFFEDFENGGEIPTGWINEGSNLYDWGFRTNTFYSNPISSDHTSGSGYFAFFDSELAMGDNIGRLTSPVIDMTSLSSPELSFWYNAPNSEGIEKLEVNIYANSTWFTDVVLGLDHQTTGWEEVILDLSSYQYSDFKLQFKVVGDYTRAFGVDDVKIDEASTCPNPSALVVNSITSSSATLSWTENGTATAWNVEYGESGFSLGTGTSEVAGANLLNITGLSQTTEYQFYVQADCGGEQSNWNGPYTFTTSCGGVAIPWSEGFEADFPSCMIEIGDYILGTSSSSNNRYARTGLKYLYTKYNADDYVFSVPLELTGGVSYDFSTWFITDGNTGWSTVELFYSSTQDPADIIEAFQAINDPANTEYSELRGIFTPAATGTCYVGMHVIADDNPWYITFDDLLVEESPSCPKPSYLDASDVTSSSALLSWTENGTAAKWNIEYDTTGFALGTGALIVDILSNPYDITGLNPDTDYDFYVQSDCATDDQSEWVGPFSFSTLCSSFSTPWTEGFEYGFPSCMEKTLKYSVWDATEYARTGFNCMAAVWGCDNDDWMYSVPLDLTAGISYDFSLWYNTDGGAEWHTIELAYFTSTDTLTVIDTIAVENNVTNTEYSKIYGSFTPATSGVFYVGVHLESGFGANSLNIDDMEVVESPSCYQPWDLNASNITSNSFDISWNQQGAPTSWNIEYGSTGFTQGSGTMLEDILTNPVNITGLDVATTYDFYVQADCGAGDLSEWSSVFTYTTSCNLQSIPWTEGFEGGIPSCMLVNDAFTLGTSALGYNREARTGSNYIYSEDVVDDWIISVPLDLTAGVSYDVTLWYITGGGLTWDELEIKLGTSQDVNYMDQSIKVRNDLDALEYIPITASFTPTVSGENYVGIYLLGTNSDGWVGYFVIDDIEIVETPPCENITVFPWSESFENNYNNIPTCWTEEFFSEQINWTFGIGDGVLAPQYGNVCAKFKSSMHSGVTKLITPELDLTSLSSPALSFYHAQRAWAENQDTLRVFYKTTPNGEWNLISGAEWSSEISEWTNETIILPSPSSTYYIAFEGSEDFAKGILLDNILVDNFIEMNHETDILTYSVPGQTSSSIIDNNNHVITAEVANGTDLTSLVATFTLSNGANAEVAGETQFSGSITNDFTNSVTYTIIAEDGITTQDWIVIVSDSVATAINEHGLNTEILVYPNPNKGIFELNVNCKKQENIIITIADINGKEIYNKQINNEVNFTENIDVSNYSKGVYLLKINTDSYSKVEKIIIH